jgi:hypothetical protein
MSDVKKASLIKKPLKVAVEEPSTEISSDPVEEQNIQASKKVKKTPEEIKETRLANLAKGQAGLKKRQEENRQKKAELESAAIEKKLRLAAKQKKNIEDSYGVSLDESSDEEVVAPIPAPKRKVVVVAAPLPKKKPIRYVEQPESESEEEIVYVKRQAPVLKKAAPSLPQIMFY